MKEKLRIRSQKFVQQAKLKLKLKQKEGCKNSSLKRRIKMFNHKKIIAEINIGQDENGLIAINVKGYKTDQEAIITLQIAINAIMDKVQKNSKLIMSPPPASILNLKKS